MRVDFQLILIEKFFKLVQYVSKALEKQHKQYKPNAKIFNGNKIKINSMPSPDFAMVLINDMPW